MDLSHYKPKDRDWSRYFREKMGDREFMEYTDRVWLKLQGLSSREEYDIVKNVKEENWDVFVKTCCWFITRHPDYYMSNDYSKICRI